MISALKLGVSASPEQKKVVLFTTLSFFCLGLPRVVTNAAAFALFLGEFDAALLPYTYLGAALVAPAAGAGYLWLQRRVSLWTLLIVALAFDIAALGIARAGLASAFSQGFVVGLAIWVEVEWVIAGLVFWGLAQRLFNIREAKRLFGIIGAGEPAAVIVGGFLISFLLAVMETEDLVLVSMAAMAASGAVILAIRRGFKAGAGPGDEGEGEGGGYRYGRYSAYVAIVFAATVVGGIAHFFADNAFYGEAEAAFADEELASFIGLFFALVGAVNLVLNLAVSAFVLRRHGVGVALAVLPLLVGVSALAALGAGWLLGGGLAFFVLVCLVKLIDEAVRNGIYTGGFLTVFQPLPPELRTRAHAANDSTVEQVGAAVAGGALIALNAVIGFAPVMLMVALVALALVWFVLARLLFHRYKAVLAQAFDRRRLTGELDLSEETTLAAIARRLRGSRPGEIVYALHLLEHHAPERLHAELPALVAHADADVRREALAVVARGHLAGVREAVAARLKAESQGDVVGMALRALAAIDGAAAIDTLRPYLDCADVEARLGAFVGLMRDASIEGLLVAAPHFLALLRAPGAADRRLAARVLDELASPQFYRLLADNIRSGDRVVQRLALRTAARIRVPELQSILLDLLRSPELGQAALMALSQADERILKEAVPLYFRGDIDAGTRARIAALCGRIGDAQSQRFLADNLALGDLDERFATAAALFSAGYGATAGDGALWRSIEAALADLALVAVAPVGDGAALGLLRSSLAQAADRQRQRLLLLLGLVLPRAPMQQAMLRLRRGTAEDRAHAVEIIDTLLPGERKETVLRPFEDRTIEAPAEIAALAQRFAEAGGTVTPWLRAVALYALAEADPTRAARHAGLWRVAADRYLAETARALSRGRPPAPLPHSAQSGRTPMLTIEKVIILRTISIFANVPDYLLADIAERLDEIEVDAGHRLITEGEMGDTLFIIIEGRFRVTRGGRELAELGSGGVFGELALLDPEPRSASVEALAPSRLFVLGHEHIDDLIAGNVDIAMGFMRMLCRRLRATSALMTAAGDPAALSG